MTSRSRSLPWLIAVVLATASARARAQDTPLYRDPSPAEGPRIEGPILPPRAARSGQEPPPPSGLGPFQSSNPDAPVPAAAGPLREPLLVVPPTQPPLPALPMPAMQPVGDVEFRRKTTIRPPDGPLGRFHCWFREAVFGPPRPPGAPEAPKRGLFGLFHPTPSEDDAPPRLFRFNWPSWPLSSGH